MRAAMAEPLHSIWRKGCVILSIILLSIPSRLSRRNSSSIMSQFKKAALSKLPKFTKSIESYVIYVVGDDT
jgi:hypothetical protein